MRSVVCYGLAAVAGMCCNVSSVFAAGCAAPRNAFDSVYCMSGRFSQADKELNTLYGNLRKGLTVDQKQQLKKGQLEWIAARDNECSYHRDNGYFVNLDCAYKKTQERMDFLRERQRECQSTGCQGDKL